MTVVIAVAVCLNVNVSDDLQLINTILKVL